MRLIDADRLKKELEQVRFAVVGFEGVLFIIDNTPTEVFTFEEAFQKTVCEQELYCPKRPQGEWEKIEGCFRDRRCSNCKRQTPCEEQGKFCINCGAKMLQKDQEE